MFFFFFESLYDRPIIYNAFKNICLDKMLVDGYFDMRKYVEGKIKRLDMYADLQKVNSKFAELYMNEYPMMEEALAFWIGVEESLEITNEVELTQLESEAIIYWVYQICTEKEEREQITAFIFSHIKQFYGIENQIKFKDGIAYNSKKVEIELISSVSGFYNIIMKYKIDTERLFFRGHSNANYKLMPSVFRTFNLKQNESKMYNEIMIECPKDFQSSFSHLDKLVEMQHYGLPTRLLDITRNPLVAMYFACSANEESVGEIILISANFADIKYPQSDAVALLASLPAFNYEQQRKFYDAATDTSLTEEDFNRKIAKLLHEVRQEKPAFLSSVNREDLLSNFIVYAIKNNQRIVKQDGAFIICGLEDFYGYSAEKISLNKFRYRAGGKTIIVLVENKKALKEELATYSINQATLFPEIESVAQYIKNKYQ